MVEVNAMDRTDLTQWEKNSELDKEYNNRFLCVLCMTLTKWYIVAKNAWYS